MLTSELEFTCFLSIDQCLPLNTCFLLIDSCSFIISRIHIFCMLKHSRVLFHGEGCLVSLKGTHNTLINYYYHCINVKFIQPQHLKYNWRRLHCTQTYSKVFIHDWIIYYPKENEQITSVPQVTCYCLQRWGAQEVMELAVSSLPLLPVVSAEGDWERLRGGMAITIHSVIATQWMVLKKPALTGLNWNNIQAALTQAA